MGGIHSRFSFQANWWETQENLPEPKTAADPPFEVNSHTLNRAAGGRVELFANRKQLLGWMFQEPASGCNQTRHQGEERRLIFAALDAFEALANSR